jgi:hypothetical protein
MAMCSSTAEQMEFSSSGDHVTITGEVLSCATGEWFPPVPGDPPTASGVGRPSPGDDPSVVEQSAGRAVIRQGRESDCDRCALLGGLGAVERVEVGRHVSEAGVVDQHVEPAGLRETSCLTWVRAVLVELARIFRDPGTSVRGSPSGPGAPKPGKPGRGRSPEAVFDGPPSEPDTFRF